MIPSCRFRETGHWFLEGWIGDHSVDFLVDWGSSVTAMSNSLHRTLVRTGAPWECWNILRECYAVQMGLELACRAALTAWCHSDGVSHPCLRLSRRHRCHHGHDVLGSVLPHTLDINNGLLFTEGGASLQLH